MTSSDEAKEKLHARKFDLIIYDADSVRRNGQKPSAFGETARKRPETRAIVISDSEELHASGPA